MCLGSMCKNVIWCSKNDHYKLFTNKIIGEQVDRQIGTGKKGNNERLDVGKTGKQVIVKAVRQLDNWTGKHVIRQNQQTGLAE